MKQLSTLIAVVCITSFLAPRLDSTVELRAEQVYTEDEIRAIVQEAASRNVTVLAHAHGDEGAMAAVKAGVRSIEHGTYCPTPRWS